MNSVKDFTIGQRVVTDLGDGTVSKIGRIYVYVEIDGTDKVAKLTPADLREFPQVVEDLPVVVVTDEAHELLGTTGSGKSFLVDLAGKLDNAAPVGGRPPMRLKGKRADADHRRAARKQQRRSRKANRSR